MTKRAKTSITLILTILVAIAGFFAWTRYRERSETPVVQAERIERRDLVATVEASGKLEPERLVNISADTMGRVTDLAVEEGEEVEEG